MAADQPLHFRFAFVPGSKRLSRGFDFEAFVTPIGAEVVIATVVRHSGGRVRGLDLHAAYRVDRVTVPAAESITMAIQPVEHGERGETRDVEERRVIPLEVR